MAKLVLQERRKHPTWGAKKIHDLLLKVHGIEDRPHVNTVGNILKSYGLLTKRKRRSGLFRVHPEHLTIPTRANEVWTFDFKGWFILGNLEFESDDSWRPKALTPKPTTQ